MKLMDQIIFNENLGDCFRACVASIFEFPIEKMPNFWEQTQDANEFWILVNKWTAINLGYNCMVVSSINNEIFKYLLNEMTCVAIGPQLRNKEQHSVIWKNNGLFHDPHPSRVGLSEQPTIFVFFVPLVPGSLSTHPI